jgi:S-layer homology domain
MRRLFPLIVCSLSFSLAQFPDVPAGHWAESAVQRMTELGVITGFPDGQFRGDDNVTRYQIALMLSRMWDSWSTEQLSEIWSNLIGVSSRVDALDEQYETLKQTIDDVQITLEGYPDTGSVEERLLMLEAALDDANGGFVDTETFLDFETNYTDTLRRLEQDVSDLRLQLPSLSDRDLEETLNQLTLQMEVLRTELLFVKDQMNQTTDYASNSSVNDLSNKLGTLETQFEPLTTWLGGLEQSLSAIQVQLEQWDKPQVVGDITLATGFVGRTWQGTFGVGLETSFGRLDAIASDGSFEARAKGYVLPLLALQGRIKSQTGLGMVGLEASLGGLDIGLLGGADDGLAGTLYIVHNGDAADAVIPGLNFFGAASLGEKSDGTRFMVRLHAAYRFTGESFYLEPSFAYETGSVSESYSLLAPGLGAGVRLGDSALLAVAAHYVFASSSREGQTQSHNFPQAKLELSFDKGAFVNVTVDGGGPDFTTLPSFDTNSALPQDLRVGASVGYTLRLVSLWQ